MAVAQVADDVVYECQVSVANWEAWPEAKKEWCCRREDLGCGFQCSESPDAAGRESDQPERVGQGTSGNEKSNTHDEHITYTWMPWPLEKRPFFLRSCFCAVPWNSGLVTGKDTVVLHAAGQRV